jgi:hypothetical protein
MHNSGEVWDGVIGNPERNLELLTGAPPTAQDLQSIVDEVVATQRGLVSAGNAVKGLQDRFATLQAQLQDRSDTESADLLKTAVELQQALVAAADKTSAALVTLVDHLSTATNVSGIAAELARMGNALTANTDTVASAIKTLVSTFKAYNDLLADFDGDPEQLRYWATQAARCLHFFGVHDGATSDTAGGFMPGTTPLAELQ